MSNDTWRTPDWLFEELNREFNFTFLSALVFFPLIFGYSCWYLISYYF